MPDAGEVLARAGAGAGGRADGVAEDVRSASPTGWVRRAAGVPARPPGRSSAAAETDRALRLGLAQLRDHPGDLAVAGDVLAEEDDAGGLHRR